MPAQSYPLDQGHPRIVAVAASAGGLPVIAGILASLPADFPAAIVIVQHLGRRRPSRFVDILRQSAAVGVRWLDDGEHLDRGWAYVAPPGRHVVVNPDGRLSLLDARRVEHARLTANPLFASAAETYGRDAIAVVLTGWLFDGATGALAVRRAGGIVVAQDPASALAPAMPLAAIAAGAVHFVLPPSAIGKALIALTMMPGTMAMFGRAAAV